MLKQKSPISRYEGLLYALLRVVAGAMFACHGMQSILGWFTTAPRPRVGSQSWVGGIIELCAGILIALGLFTRWAAFVASGTMAVAFVQFHWKLALDHWKWVPIVNRGELALLYSFLFLFFTARGGGAASIDRRIGRE